MNTSEKFETCEFNKAIIQNRHLFEKNKEKYKNRYSDS